MAAWRRVAERLKRRVFDILQIPSPPGDKAGHVFDVGIIALILLNTAAVIVETLPGVTSAYGPALRAFELVSVVIFSVEYVLRLWSITADARYARPVGGRVRWMLTPFAIIDVLAVVPAFLFAFDLRFLRVLRVLRILKLGRYAESVQILGNVLRRSSKELLTSLFLVALALILTSSFMYYAERDAQPDDFSSIPTAMWWSIVALTTTGYGDVVPITGIGRVVGGITALLGVATIALPIGILSSNFIQEIEARRKAAAHGPELCPHCGKDVKQEVVRSVRVSVRSDAGVCKYCGRVDLASRMVRVEESEHGYVYACEDCAAKARGQKR